MSLPNTVLVWSGASLHPDGNGESVGLFATGLRTPSGNLKTGPMIQTYILALDADPILTVRGGDDSSVCGACPQSPTRGGGCYVNIGHAPLGIWRAWERGSVPAILPGQWGALGDLIRGRMVRMGAYGDPAAVPVGVWERILRGAAGWTGYTHAWRSLAPRHPLSRLCMASCDNPGDIRPAQAKGWRAFAMASDPSSVAGAIPCPHYTHALTCADCGLCAGSSIGAKHITVRPHGAKSGRILSTL